MTPLVVCGTFLGGLQASFFVFFFLTLLFVSVALGLLFRLLMLVGLSVWPELEVEVLLDLPLRSLLLGRAFRPRGIDHRRCLAELNNYLVFILPGNRLHRGLKRGWHLECGIIRHRWHLRLAVLLQVDGFLILLLLFLRPLLCICSCLQSSHALAYLLPSWTQTCLRQSHPTGSCLFN